MNEPTCKNGHPLTWFNISYGKGHGICTCDICGVHPRPGLPNTYDRFWAQAVPEPMSGCWLWSGTVNHQGYGQFTVDGKTLGAHIVAFTMMGGLIPAGYQLDHLCRTRSCVWPDHLEPVEPVENVRRSHTPMAITLNTGSCQRGHEMTGHNILKKPNGQRQCRACFRIQNKRAVARYRARIRGEVSAMPEMSDEDKAARFGGAR